MTEITNHQKAEVPTYALPPETMDSLAAISHELYIEVTIHQRFDISLIEKYIVMAYKCGRYDEMHKNDEKL